MTQPFDPVKNYESTRKRIGYVPRENASAQIYANLGFRCGLEIHQQLKTEKKLFCRCPAGIYQHPNDFDAEIIRHMRPTLSELGEYDGTALMEFKTKKNIIYRIKNETACTYEFDDTPPFLLNQEALDIAMEIALLLKTNIVGELHITRKQYLDGSIPTGFQRTAIVGIEGELSLPHKTVRVIQLSVEEDACREVSDIGHVRIYTTDRLGMPLIETVTYPDMLTPDEAAQTAHHIRFLTRSSGKVRTGIGAAREDVNVSITGGTRVEIKGVSHISWIPELTHNEAFRQKALLDIKDILRSRLKNPEDWNIQSRVIDTTFLAQEYDLLKSAEKKGGQIVALNLPGFKELLSFFTQPGKCFADEISDRLKVVACIEKPNMTHSEALQLLLIKDDWEAIQNMFNSSDQDAQIILWGPKEDIPTAIETVEERCRLAFAGVPNETRKSLKDGTTIFERVLPGPDRMYPDTDSAPIPIEEAMIEKIRKNLPSDISYRLRQLQTWKVASSAHAYILKRNLFPLIEKIIRDFNIDPSFVGNFLGHQLRHIEGQTQSASKFNTQKIYELFDFLQKQKLNKEIAKRMLPVIYQYPNIDFHSVLTTIGYNKHKEQDILAQIPLLRKKFKQIRKSKDHSAETAWIMGRLHPMAVGNIDLRKLKKAVVGGADD